MNRYTSVQKSLQSDPKRWLVTGAAGFIGSAIVEQLIALGQHVVGLDNFETGHRENVEPFLPKFTFVEADIRDLDACRAACEGIDFISHQAAIGSVPRSIDDPIGSHQANVDGFVNIAVAAKDAGVKRLVYASSSSVYGDDPRLPKLEDNIGDLLSPYATTKRVDELYAAVVQRVYGLETVGLRYFNVYGRRQDPDGPYAAVIPRWLDLILARKPCVIYGDGSSSRDFCYVDNAVQANILAATCNSSATNAVYNVGCGGRTDLKELFDIIRDLVARKHVWAKDAVVNCEPPRDGDIPHSQANIGKIVDALGYEPTHDVQTGMAETVSWFLGRSG